MAGYSPMTYNTSSGQWKNYIPSGPQTHTYTAPNVVTYTATSATPNVVYDIMPDFTEPSWNVDSSTPEQIPLWADARTIKASIEKQIEVLESLQDGLEGKAAQAVSDTIYYLQESIEALEKITN